MPVWGFFVFFLLPAFSFADDLKTNQLIKISSWLIVFLAFMQLYISSALAWIPSTGEGECKGNCGSTSNSYWTSTYCTTTYWTTTTTYYTTSYVPIAPVPTSVPIVPVPNHMLARNAYALGNNCFQRGDYYNALPYYQEAIRLNPDLYEAYNYLGIVLEKLGRYDEAIDMYRQASRPGNFEAAGNLASLQRWLDNEREKERRAHEEIKEQAELARHQQKLKELLDDLGKNIIRPKDGNPATVQNSISFTGLDESTVIDKIAGTHNVPLPPIPTSTEIRRRYVQLNSKKFPTEMKPVVELSNSGLKLAQRSADSTVKAVAWYAGYTKDQLISTIPGISEFNFYKDFRDRAVNNLEKTFSIINMSLPQLGSSRYVQYDTDWENPEQKQGRDWKSHVEKKIADQVSSKAPYQLQIIGDIYKKWFIEED